MIINNKEYDVDKLVKELDIENSFLKRRSNGLMLSNDMIEILKKNNIDYLKYNNLKELIFDINNILNEEYIWELEKVLIDLSEIDYYNYTNK